MALTPGEAKTLWKQRIPVLTLRDPRWVLQSFWIPPLLVVLPFLASRFSRNVLLGGAIAAVSFTGYSMVTYGLWRSVARERSVRVSRARLCILAIMGYDTLGLLYTSICFLSAFLFGVVYLPVYSEWVIVASMLLYSAIGIGLILRRDSIVRYLMRAHQQAQKRPLAPEARWAMTISSELVGAGVALGAVLRTSPLGTLLGIGAAALASFLLLPFAIIALAQVLMMVGRQSDLAAETTSQSA